MRTLRTLLLLTISWLLATGPVLAGGAWYVDIKNSARPYHWPQGKLTWYVENSKLGPLTANEVQNQIIEQFNQWATAGILMPGSGVLALPKSLQTAKLDIKFGGPISGNVATWDQAESLAKNRTVFVLDNDYDLLERDPSIGAMTYIHLVNPDTMEIHTALSILNGNADVLQNAKIGNTLDPNWRKFQAILLHEIGHMLNLDHSAVHADHQEAVESGAEDGDQMPVMFPMIVSGEQNALHQDDIVAASNLYPTTALTSELCEIVGRVIGENGRGFQGAQIMAESTLDPTANAIGVISGAMFTQGTADGSYIIRGIIPGVPYEVTYAEVPQKFVGASSVQPFGDDYGKNGELPRAGFGTGVITSNAGALRLVECNRGGDTILMDTVQLAGVDGVGVEAPVDLLPDASVVLGEGAGASSGTAKRGCSLIL